MGKKFVGLGGLKHFWTKAKTWIAGQITAEVTAKIAEIVANAPEDLDTLKEIADWIKTHANDASAMNTQINTNKSDIAALQTSVAGKAAASHTHDDRYFTETEVTSKLAGKSDTGHKHSASDITSGTLPVANGGTGVTTQADINKAFVGALEEGTSDVTDGTMFVSSYASDNGFADTNAVNKPYKRKFSSVWEYIKGKISSVLGLTASNYGGKASTAGTADKTVNDITIGIPYVSESGQYVIPLGNILQPGSGEVNSPYNWDITGFFSIIRASGHAGSHINFAAGHGYSHGFTTYAYLDEESFTEAGDMRMSIKAFQYNGEWWLGLWINTQWQGYFSKMTVTFSRGLPATPTCILYNSVSDGVANEEIYNSIQDIPSRWWKTRTIYNPITFTQNITAPVIKATTNFTGNLTGDVTGNVTGSSGSCTGNSAQASFLDEYPGAGSARLTSLNIVPKDASEYGGMRKDVVTSSVTDSSRPGQDGHLLTMFWDSDDRWDNQLFISNDLFEPPTLKLRQKLNETDYGPWTDIITSNNIGSQSVSSASSADKAVSVVDAGDTSKTIKIGYTGAGLTASELGYVAGYKSDGSGVQIKAVSKDVLQEWLDLDNYLPLSGGTMTGKLDVKTAGIRIPTSRPNSLSDGDIWIQ